MFENRHAAGIQLAKALSRYQDKNPLVLVIPHGGVPVGYEVAKALRADISILIVQKLPFPFNPQESLGAIAETRIAIVLAHASRNFEKSWISEIISDQIEEIKRKRRIFRMEQKLPSFAGRTVILVDDGIKLGVTMKAAIKYVHAKNAGQIIVAAPVSSPEAAHAFSQMYTVDDVVILEKPQFFYNVAQSYIDWHKVTDHEVLRLVKLQQSSLV